MARYHYVQLNIGRNVDNVPMSDRLWSTFRIETTALLDDLLFDFEGVSDTTRIMCHEGWGYWEGVREESVHYSVVLDISRLPSPLCASVMAEFARAIRQLAEDYGQDSIGLITGSRLIKPKRGE